MRLTAPSPRRQEGIAVITAMLIVTIAAVLAVEMVWETTLDLRRTEGLLGWDQARQFAYGAEDLVAKILREDAERASAEPADWLGEDWAQPAVFSLDQGMMSGNVIDLQGRFNLNNLVQLDGRRDDTAYELFQRLLAALDLDQSIADVVVDWIDPDTSASFNGAEDDAYTSMDPPYRTANFWFTNVSELRALRGVDADVYERLAPHVAALPRRQEPTRINVNTATVAVLQSLGESITPANAEQWMSDRLEEPFSEDLSAFAGFIDPALPARHLGISSGYFALQGTVSIGTTRLAMYSLMERNGQNVLVKLRTFDAFEAVPPSGPANLLMDSEAADRAD